MPETIVDVIQRLEALPDFAGLSYEEQLQARAWVTAERIKDHPAYLEASLQVREATMDSLVFRPPVFEQGGLARVVGLPIDVETNQTVAAYQQQQDPLKRQVASRMMALTTLNQSLSETMIGRAARIPVNAIGRLLGQDFTEVERDEDKQSAYYRYTIQDDERALNKFKWTSLAGSLMGIGIDFLPLYAGLVGTLANPAGPTRALMGVLNRTGARTLASGVARADAGRAASFIYGKGGRAFIHSVGGGAANVVREGALYVMDEHRENPSFQDFITKAPRYLGEGFVGDWFFFGAGGMWSFATAKAMARAMGHHFKGWGARARRVSPTATDEQWQSVFDGVLSSEGIPRENVLLLPPELQEIYHANRAATQVTRSVESVKPGSDIEVIAQLARKGWISKHIDDGTWEAWSVTDPGNRIQMGDDEVRSFMAELLTTPDTPITGVLRQQREEAFRGTLGRLGARSTDVRLKTDNVSLEMPSPNDLRGIVGTTKGMKRILAEMRRLHTPSINLPITTPGYESLVSDYIVARGLFERSVLQGTNMDGMIFGEYLDTVRYLRAKGKLGVEGEVVQDVAAGDAWWTWIPDAQELSMYRAYGDGPELAAHAWNKATYGSGSAAVGSDGKLRGSLREIASQVQKGDVPLPSQRGIVTQGEASSMVADGGGVYATARPDTPHIFSTGINEKPNAVLMMRKTASTKMWEELLRYHGSDVAQVKHGLQSQGFDSVRLSQSQFMVFEGQQAKRIVSSLDKKRAARQISQEDARIWGASSGQARVTHIIEGKAKGFGQSIEALAQIIAPRNGVINTKQVRAFSQAYLAAKHVDDQIIRSNLDRLGKGWSRRVRTPQDERAVVSSLVDELNEIVEVHAVGSMPRVLSGEQVAARYQEALSSAKTGQEIITPGWVEHALSKDRRTLRSLDGNKWMVSGSGLDEVFESLDDVVEALRYTNVSDAHVLQGLHDDLGLQVKVGGNGQWKVSRPIGTRGNQTEYEEWFTAEGRSEAMEKTGWRPKLDARYGPEIAVVDNTGTLEYKNGQIRGTYQAILKEFDRFYDPSVREARVVVDTTPTGDKLYLHKVRDRYEVEIPEIGHRREFESAEAAKEYMEGGWRDWTSLKLDANKKGYELSVENGIYIMHSSPGVPPVVAGSRVELHAAMKANNTPEWAPELIDKEMAKIKQPTTPFENTFPPAVEANYPREPFEPSTYLETAALWFRNPDGFFTRALKESGDETPLRYVHEIEQARKIASGEMARLSEPMDALHRNAEGRRYRGKRSTEVREGILQYMYPGNRALDEIASEFHLGAHEVRIAGRHKQYLERLEERFGIPMEHYMGTWRRTLKDWAYNSKDPNWRSAFGGNPPKDLVKLIGDKDRSQIATMVFDNDLIRMTTRYIHTGVDNEMVKPIKDQALAWAHDQGVGLGVIQRRLELYVHEVSGEMHKSVEKVIEFGNRMATKLGQSDSKLKQYLAPKVAGNWISRIFSSAYLATMAFRPWVPVRNSFQVWTTLALHAPNWQIGRAIQESTGKAGDLIADELRALGALPPKGTTPVFGSELIDATTFTGRMLHGKGMAAFRSSDEWTRIIAYTTMRNQWNDALAAYRKNLSSGVSPTIAQKNFMDMSNLDSMPKDIQRQSVDLMAKGEFDAAQHGFSMYIIDRTMFPYRQGTNPQIFGSVLGKAFGTFGHYPVYYTENLRHAFINMTPAKKAAAFARFSANSLAIYAVLHDVFGIDAGHNFLPWQQMVFTGGPYFQLLGLAMASASGGYIGRQALRQLPRELSRLTLPGSSAFSGLSRGIEQYANGESYAGLLLMMGFPVRRDWLWESTL